MRLVHLHTHDSNNIGNAALGLGTRVSLGEDLPGVEFHPEPFDEYNWSGGRRYEDLVRKLNEGYDGMIVGASSVFDWTPRYRNSGFRFDLPFELWDRIRKPVVFYGVGYAVHQDRRRYHLDAFRRSIRKAISLPNVLFSVRNDGTKEWLERTLESALPEIRVIPDPAVYVPTTPSPHPALRADRPNVLLTFNTDGETYRFGGRWPQSVWRYLPDWKRRRKRFLEGLASAFLRLADEHDYQLVIAPHTPIDFGMTADFLRLLPRPFLHYRVTTMGVSQGYEAGQVHYDAYRHAAAAVTMRVHSYVCALGLGTPTVVLGSMARTGAFLRDVGFEDHLVEVTDPAVGDRVLAHLRRMLTDPTEVRARAASIRTALRPRTVAFDREVAALLGAV